MAAIAKRAAALLRRIEDGLLVVIIAVVILMASAQILFRNFFELGIAWGDIFVRNMVLWIGLVGAMVASREDKHIRIEALTRCMGTKMRRMTATLTALFSGAVCTVAAVYGGRFTLMEYEFGSTAFAQVPTWACVLIIPVGFGVISARFFISAYINLKAPPEP